MRLLTTLGYAATSAVLISGPALAQQPPTSKPNASEIKSQCIAEGKNAGLNAALLDDYVKQCINRNSAGNSAPDSSK